MTTWKKYAAGAERWSEEAYADSARYLTARAQLVGELGPPLAAGDIVLDLACGDGGFGDFLPEQRYVGVDASPEMVAAGRARGREIVEADINGYEPAQPVQATTIFRAIYYAGNRLELFRRIAQFTETKLVFDLNPRQFSIVDVRADLSAAGFDVLTTRPFFVPQTHALPAPVGLTLRALERLDLPARALLRRRFTIICAASRAAAS